ncbi:MAG: hypothetical protein Faunusvirus2_10 [Faunusvirus sp.]|jgi:hypothetical protein|uniref:Uncharacterized protein n=1 Tax=Faunusvirus sp. TaxID=2487766 RepID=A0A3G4ZZQ8_9VIRU|nr:MAG: hypothetical protein Faunusvirus2_10 [Faunusvirus sp.]
MADNIVVNSMLNAVNKAATNSGFSFNHTIASNGMPDSRTATCNGGAGTVTFNGISGVTNPTSMPLTIHNTHANTAVLVSIGVSGAAAGSTVRVSSATSSAGTITVNIVNDGSTPSGGITLIVYFICLN